MTRFTRPTNSVATLFVAFLLLLPFGATGQTFPSKPVALVVSVSAGGTIDAVARIIGQELSPRLGQPVLVENRPGAGGNIAADYVAKAPADGHTLMICSSSTLTINPHIYKNLPFHPEKSFEAVTIPVSFNMILAVSAKHDVSTMRQFVDIMKARHGQLNFGSSGIGTLPHIAGELLAKQVGAKVNHIPYKGLQPALTDLLGGQIDFMFDSGAGVPYMKGGKLRALAVVGPHRFPSLPQVATFKELGVQGMEVASGWFGIFAPAGTPRPVIERLHSEIAKTLALPLVKDKLIQAGVEADGSRPDQTAARLRSDLLELGALIKQLNITIQ